MPREAPVLDQVNVIAKNMRASLAFYRQLDVSFPVDDASGEPFHANGQSAGGLDLDLDSPEFARVWNKGWAGRQDLAGRVVIGFGLKSREAVDQTYAELTGAGHRGLQPPYDAFWGARYAVVEDPNGIAVGLMSPVDPEKKSWPPAGWPR
jgi:uncharacterized glyoxalase superfamily protein PhnB